MGSNSVLVGERRTYFFWGEKYTFERVAKGEWKCVYRDCQIIPSCILDELSKRD
jgi:hypothetical protein